MDDDPSPEPEETPTENPTETTPISRLGRLVLLAILVLVAAEALYLAAGNAFLRMPWGQEVISRADKRQISWDDAWTPLPGVVRVEGFEMRARTPKVTWRLAIDEAWLWMAPLELLAKRFHVRWIRAAGGETQVRLRGRDAAGQPVVEGFGDLPAPEPRGERSRPWRLAFDDVTVTELGELWIGPLRYRPATGEGVARGRLEVVVKESVALPRLDAELAPGRADLGEEVRAQVKRLTFDGRIEPFDPSEVKGTQRFGYVSGHLLLETSEGSLGLVEQYFRGTPASVRADGELVASLHARRGRLLAPTWLEIGDGSLGGRYLGWRAEGEGGVRGRVHDDGSAQLTTRLDHAQLFRRDDPLLDAEDLRLEATAKEVDLTEAQPAMEIRAVLPPTTVEDLGIFDRYLPAEGPFRLSGGTGTFEAEGRVATGPRVGEDLRFHGSMALRADGLRGRVRGRDLRTDLSLDVRVPWLDLDSRAVGIEGTRLEIRNLRGGGVRGWWAEVDVEDGRARSGEDWGVDGRVVARVKDSSPLLALVTGQHPRLSILDRLLTVHDLEMEATVRSDAESAELRDAVLRGPGSTRVLGEVRFDDGEHEMLLHASWGPFALGIYQGRQIDVDLRHSLEWFERRKKRFWEEK